MNQTFEPGADATPGFSGAFASLSPERVFRAVEDSFGLPLVNVISPYPSYTNRVYGLTTEDGRRLAAKFYRPGRWSREAVLEEHQYLSDCAAAEIPVVPPLPDRDGGTLPSLALEPDGTVVFWSLFPLRAGRNFEANSSGDWTRLGGLLGRVHEVGKTRECRHRLACTPARTTRPFVDELAASGLVPEEQAAELFPLLFSGLEMIEGLFDAPLFRIHGDCHAGNILDRGPEGLLLFDFDDMMNGPAVQDLWLLLPEHADRAGREIDLLLEGYTRFAGFDAATLKLIEPLRFMRIVYFLLWCARQRHDYDFSRHFPDWGTKAFWIREIGDLTSQIEIVAGGL